MSSTTTITPRFLSVKDAQRYTSLSRSTLYRLIDESKLRVRKVAGRTLFDVRELDRLCSGKSVSDAG